MSETRPQADLDVIAQLRQAILRGSFQPNQRLIEAELASMFDTNRANVRVALAVLEQEGLVDREVNRGARVRMVSEEEALEIVDVRLALEARVAFLAASKATPEDCQALQNLADRMRKAHGANEYLVLSELNDELHQKLQAIAANQTLSKILKGLKSRLVRLQFRSILMPGRADRSVVEHINLIDAIIAGDPDRADKAMRIHMEGVKEGLRLTIEMHRATLMHI